MTRAVIYRDSPEGDIVGFKILGHAGYASEGYDIICAAISILSINTINSIEKFTDSDCKVISREEKAELSLQVKSTRSFSEVQILLKSFELGLISIAEGNPEFLSITYREV